MASDELKVRLNFLRNKKIASDLLLILSNFPHTEKEFSRPKEVSLNFMASDLLLISSNHLRNKKTY